MEKQLKSEEKRNGKLECQSQKTKEGKYVKLAVWFPFPLPTKFYFLHWKTRENTRLLLFKEKQLKIEGKAREKEIENWNASHSSVNKPKSPLSFGHGLRGLSYITSAHFCTFSPSMSIVSINTVLNVSKNCHFLNQPTQSICWRNKWTVP